MRDMQNLIFSACFCDICEKSWTSKKEKAGLLVIQYAEFVLLFKHVEFVLQGPIKKMVTFSYKAQIISTLKY